MVSIFAREITDDLTSLVKELDRVVGENGKAKKKKKVKGKAKGQQPMAAFVVLLSDDPDADEKTLQALAKKEGIKNVPLTIFDGISGPPRYKIAKDADVTVMMWAGLTVKSNHAFAEGEFNADSVGKILDEVVSPKKSVFR